MNEYFRVGDRLRIKNKNALYVAKSPLMNGHFEVRGYESDGIKGAIDYIVQLNKGTV